MTTWIRNRSILAILLVGGVGIIVILGLLLSATTAHFLRRGDHADAIRKAADSLNRDFLKAEHAEKDFLLEDLRDPEFFKTGLSKNLQAHKTLMTQIPARLEDLARMSTGRERELAGQGSKAIATYNDAFQKMVATLREKGYGEWGVEGQWRGVVRGMEQDLAKAKDMPLQLELLQLRRNEKDYLMRGDSKYADAVYAGAKNLSARVAASRDTIFAKKAQESLQSYEELFRRYVALEEKIGKTDAVGLWGETRRAATAVEPLLDDVLQQAEMDNDAAHQQLITAGLLALVIGVAVATWFFYFVARSVANPVKQLSAAAGLVAGGDLKARMNFESQNELGTLARGFNEMMTALSALVGDVHKSGIQVNTSVTEIAATAKQQQATASEIAATTTEIGATSKEISATSRELVKTLGEVAEVADESATLAGNGQAGLSQMEETMRHVMEAAGSINAKLAVLSEKAGNINQVVTTITKVADQTNLLSLNAAIEAEKAGEYGRGFSVVATEIRRLADQTAVATYDIEQMVKEIQSAVAAGVMGMDKFSEEVRRGMQEVQQVGGQLSQIIQQVQALAPRVESVNEGMQAQATGAEQISQALSQLTEAAQQTVESLSQSTIAISELNQVSARLRDGVSRFQLQA